MTAQRTQGLGYKPDSIRQDYTGYQKDEESGGLEFAQARYYNTKHGRFTSIDPLTASANVKDPQTFNRYSYAMNSPYKFTDPLGLISSSTGANGHSSDSPKLKCGIVCRVESGTASKLDLHRLQYHVANGTALGYTYQNAVQSRQHESNSGNPPPPPVNTGMTLSKDGQAMLSAEGMEGYRSTPYDNDGSGTCTVGIGHALSSGGCNPKNPDHVRKYSAAEIQQFFDDDVADAQFAVISKINVKLKQEQFDALVMLAFNYTKFGGDGAPKLIAAINGGYEKEEYRGGWISFSVLVWKNEASIRKEWGDIIFAKGKKVPGLVTRRKYEIQLFFEGSYIK